MMGRKTKKHLMFGVIAIMLSSAACSKLDVVGNDSARAFEEVLQILAVEDTGFDWSIAAPDGGAEFLWNGESAAVTVLAQPFINAGFDINKLSNTSDGNIVIGMDFQSTGRDKTAPLDDYKRIVDISPNSIGYHMAMDHYNIDLGGGNVFEWAKDLRANDKDIVFVLNPEPLINAGVDPNAVDGWIFAKVEVAVNGKMVEVDKLMKHFDLK